MTLHRVLTDSTKTGVQNLGVKGLHFRKRLHAQYCGIGGAQTKRERESRFRYVITNYFPKWTT